MKKEQIGSILVFNTVDLFFYILNLYDDLILPLIRLYSIDIFPKEIRSLTLLGSCSCSCSFNQLIVLPKMPHTTVLI